MKTLIVYSSKTGNTRKVAEAVSKQLPDAELFDAKTAPDPAGYDLVFMGFWVDKGTADKGARKFMEKISNQRVALFATLGAYPDSEHATKSLDAAGELIPTCEIVDRFICQGAIDPKLIKWMKLLPKGHPHAVDDARKKRWADAESHPDEQDFKNIQVWAEKIVS